MKIVDLSHNISPDMPVYPGTPRPLFATGASIDADGFRERKITMFSHTGTHIDAPAHILRSGKTLDQFAADHFYGKAWVFDHPDGAEEIGQETLARHRDKIKQTEFLLIRTGWDMHWGAERYFSEYPVLTPEAAEWLTKFGLKGVGMDTISADREDSMDFPVHRILLGSDIIIIENLTHLNRIIPGVFDFSCFPLKFVSADGSPVRAVAYLNETGETGSFR